MGRPQKYPERVKPGARFGRLEVLGVPFRAALGKGHSNWCCVVECTCGSGPYVIGTSNLTATNTKSCGCLRRETTSKTRSTHGGSREHLYRVLADIKKRCLNTRSIFYRNYGGRGITIDGRWIVDYPAFREWAMRNGYSPDLEIDRIDNNGPYSPENCRFVTAKANSRNTRRNRIIEAFGESKSVVEWAEDPRCVVCYGTLFDRLARGWNPEASISTSIHRQLLSGDLR